jgi:hypothetical protein
VAVGASLWRHGGAVALVIDDPDPGRLLDGLRSAAVRRIDVLVARRGTRPVSETVRLLRARLTVRLVLAPHGHRIRDAVVPATGGLVVGGLDLLVRATEPRLEVQVGVGAPDRRRWDPG